MRSLAEGRSGRVSRLALAILAAAAVASERVIAQEPSPQARTFRGGITMVPVDVRVLDARGEPVTDLTEADFRIFEDDHPQEIQQFVAVGLRSVAPASGRAGPAAAGAPAAATADPGNRRTFLIVLGRGRHIGPVKPFRALDRFVREQLLPQDEVALIGYNRATNFTTDHAAIAGTIDRYRREHEEIEALIAQNQNIMLGVSRPDEMPDFVQRRIDTIFGLESLALERGDPGARVVDDLRRTADDIQRAAAAGERGATIDVASSVTASFAGTSFEQYVNQAYATLDDLANIHTGLDYLRYVEGEKHLVLFTVRGLGLRDTRDEDHLAALASDARVTLDFIHTSGMVAAPPAGPLGMSPLPTPTQVFNQTFFVKGLRATADQTGGQAWAFEYGDEALEQLDRTTRFRYVLGYVPANQEIDDQYRRIRIEVTRPGLTVLYRHGYYASETTRARDGADVRALARIRQASGFMVDVRDIGVELEAEVETGPDQAREIVASLTIDTSKFEFPLVDRLRTGIVDFAVFVGNERQQVIAEAWSRRDWQLSEDGYARLREAPATETVRVPVGGDPLFVKVVVYERGSNLLGTAIVRVR